MPCWNFLNHSQGGKLGSSLQLLFRGAGLWSGGPHMGPEGPSSHALLVRTVTCARARFLLVNGVLHSDVTAFTCADTAELSQALVLARRAVSLAQWCGSAMRLFQAPRGKQCMTLTSPSRLPAS